MIKDMNMGGKSTSVQDSNVAKVVTKSSEDLSRHIDEEYEGDGKIIEPVSDQELLAAS